MCADPQQRSQCWACWGIVERLCLLPSLLLTSCSHSIRWCFSSWETWTAAQQLMTKDSWTFGMLCSSLPTWLICHRLPWCHGRSTAKSLTHTVSPQHHLQPGTPRLWLVQSIWSITPTSGQHNLLCCPITPISHCSFPAISRFLLWNVNSKTELTMCLYILIYILCKHATVSLF